jgi:hypothetical protein
VITVPSAVVKETLIQPDIDEKISKWIVKLLDLIWRLGPQNWLKARV